jgi:uncharacterized membrane protein
MTNRAARWLFPVFGVGLGVLVALAESGRSNSLVQAFVAFAIVAGYALALAVLRDRSETAQLLTGVAVDERWAAINQRALASAAQILAVTLAVTFIGVEVSGGDAMPYAWTAAVFAAGYIGSILWYRWRS